MEEGERELCYMNEERVDECRREAPCKTNKQKLAQGTISGGTKELPRTQDESSNARPTKRIVAAACGKTEEVGMKERQEVQNNDNRLKELS